MTLQPQAGRTEYYCIVPDQDRRAILLVPNGMVWTLPTVAPFPGRREFLPDDVGPIGQAASKLLGTRATVLRHLFDSNAIQACELETFGYMQMPRGAAWARADEIPHMEIAPPVAKEIVERWFKDEAKPDHRGRAAWEKRGWLLNVERRLAAELQRRHLNPLGPADQVKAGWNVSTVLRIRTDRGNLYYKEAWPKPPAEGRVIAKLAERWPGEVPQVLAATPDWLGILMADFGGKSLGAIPVASEWLAAVKRFAEIQIGESARMDEWRSIVPDLRPRNLVPVFDQILGNSRLLTHGHHALHEDEIASLRAIAPRLREMCETLETGPVPLSIMHEDFRAGNIVLKPDGNFLYYDWSWAAISHPFLSLAYFFTRGLPKYGQPWDWRIYDDDPIRPQLAQAYLEPWTQFAPMETLQGLFTLTRQLTYLYRSVTLYQSLPLLEPGTPWFAATVPQVPRFMRFILNQIALIDEIGM